MDVNYYIPYIVLGCLALIAVLSALCARTKAPAVAESAKKAEKATGGCLSELGSLLGWFALAILAVVVAYWYLVDSGILR